MTDIDGTADECLGIDRTLEACAQSALPPKADICSAQAHVCFGPKADIDRLCIKSIQKEWLVPASHFANFVQTNLWSRAMPKISGGCLCGAVRYEWSAEPLGTAICHCTHCQKVSGSAFSVNVVIPAPSLTWQGQKIGRAHV